MNRLQSVNRENYVFSRLIGTGGIGSGMFFYLEGDHTLGRNESRSGVLVPYKDYCKLHIITHYIAVLLRADTSGQFRVFPIGAVGNDEIGKQLIGEMKNAGMTVDNIKCLEEASTLFSVCFQYPDSTGGNITTSNSASAMVMPDNIDAFFEEFPLKDSNELILAAPEVPVETRIRLLEKGRERGSFNVASVLSSEVKEFEDRRGFELTDLLAINIDEGEMIAGITGESPDSEEIVKRCIERLASFNSNIMVVITDGPNGSYGYKNNRLEYVPPLQTKAVATGGAGDAFLAGVISALCCHLPFLKGTEDAFFSESPLKSAMELGTLLASLSVTSPDSIHQTANKDVLLQYATENNCIFSSDFNRLFGLND